MSLAADLYVYCELEHRRKSIVRKTGDVIVKKEKSKSITKNDDDDNDNDDDDNEREMGDRKRRKTLSPFDELRERTSTNNATAAQWLQVLAMVIDRWQDISPLTLSTLLNQLGARVASATDRDDTVRLWVLACLQRTVVAAARRRGTRQACRAIWVHCLIIIFFFVNKLNEFTVVFSQL